jgi:hypothetical protein
MSESTPGKWEEKSVETACRSSLILLRLPREAGQPPQNPMPFPLDRTLTELADQAFETTRLGRNGAHTNRDWVLSETLAKLEASGDAMRFVDSNGRIAWKATPSLFQYLKDLELDAEEDLADF